MSWKPPSLFASGQPAPTPYAALPPTHTLPPPNAQQNHHQHPSSAQTFPHSTPAMAPTPHQPIPPQQNPLASLSGLGFTPQQLTAVALLFQSGQWPQPPPFPTAPQPTGMPAQVPAPDQPSVAPHTGRIGEEDVDIDREDGELEEGEVGDTPAAHGFLRTPPKGPRNRNQQRAAQQPQISRDPRPAAVVHAASGLKTVTHAPISNGGLKQFGRSSKDMSIKDFLAAMHKAGHTFEQVSKEISDVSGLRHLYEQLSLPTSLPKVEVVPASTPNTSTAPLPNNKRKASISFPKRPAPMKSTQPQDRSEYLARLHAAQKKKPEPTRASSTPLKLPDSPATSTVSNAQPKAMACPAVSKPASTHGPAKQVHDSNLANLRARAMQSAQAAQAHKLKNLSSSNGPSSSLSTKGVDIPQVPNLVDKTVLGGSLPQSAAPADTAGSTLTQVGSVASSHAHSQVSLPAVATLSSPLNKPANQTSASATTNRVLGLPGLFTTMPAPMPSAPQRPASASAVPVTSKTPIADVAPKPSGHTIPTYPYHQTYPSFSAPSGALRPRPYHTDSFQPNGSAPYTQQYPYGGHVAEPFIIHDSDEDSSSEDDTPHDVGVITDKNTSKQPEGTARGLFQGIGLSKGSETAPGTPSSSQDLARSIEGLKRQIREKEQRKARQLEKQAQTNGEKDPVPGVDSPSTAASALSTPEHAAGAAVAGTAAGVYASVKRGDQTNPSLIDRPSPAEAPPGQQKTQQQQIEDFRALGVAMENAQKELEMKGRAIAAQPGLPVAMVEASTQPLAKAQQQHDVLDQLKGVHTSDAAMVDAEDGEIVDIQSSDDDEAMYGTDAVAESEKGVFQATTARYASMMSQAIAPGVRADPAFAYDQDEDVEDDEDLDDLYAESNPSSMLSAQVVPMTGSLTTSNDEMSGIDEESDEKGDGSQGAVDDASDSDSESDDHNDDTNDIGPDSDHDMGQSESEHDVSVELDAKQVEMINANTAPPGHGRDTDDEILAPELQPPREELAVPTKEPRKLEFFQAYKSPLARFKDFRYHPDYLHTVSRGYKSLTYNHKIDAINPVCPYETAGGACHANTCEYQHFQSMALTDNELLRAMGTQKTPVRSDEEDVRWKDGLNGVFQELRSSKQGKDASAIARRITQYRREFRGDDTKVLLLD